MYRFYQIESEPASAAMEAEKRDFLDQLMRFGIHLETVECVFTTDSKRSWICPGNIYW
jgi:hypothetical protein